MLMAWRSGTSHVGPQGYFVTFPNTSAERKSLGREEDLFKPCPVGLLGPKAVPKREGKASVFFELYVRKLQPPV